MEYQVQFEQCDRERSHKACTNREDLDQTTNLCSLIRSMHAIKCELKSVRLGKISSEI